MTILAMSTPRRVIIAVYKRVSKIEQREEKDAREVRNASSEKTTLTPARRALSSQHSSQPEKRMLLVVPILAEKGVSAGSLSRGLWGT